MPDKPMELRIEKVVYGGAGLARTDALLARTDAPLARTDASSAHHGSDEADATASPGTRKAVFVPFTLPGERVLASLSEDKRSFATASLVQVLDASPDRVAPRCPYFGNCGGCHYQHAAYDAQLAMKSAILSETLERAGLKNLPPIMPHRADPWQYRNRVRLHVTRAAGELGLGYRKAATHEVVDIRECPIAAPMLLRAASQLLLAAEQSQPAYTLLSGCSEVEIFCSDVESEMQLSLYQREPDTPNDPASMAASIEAFKELCEAIKDPAPQLSGTPHPRLAGTPHPELVGACLYSPPMPDPKQAAGSRSASSSHALRQTASWGSNTLQYTVAGFRYRVSRGAFFQINRHLVAELVGLVAHGRSGNLVWDLYAGVGLFSRSLAGHFKHVVAVEIASPANKDLAHNLTGANATAVAATTLDFLRQQTGLAMAAPTSPKQKSRSAHASKFAAAKMNAPTKQASRAVPDLIVLDPPRAGLGPDVCNLLARIAAPELVYVSCDPATLSRDLAALIESGYQLQQLHLVDMFPQTFHIETVAVLKRG